MIVNTDVFWWCFFLFFTEIVSSNGDSNVYLWCCNFNTHKGCVMFVLFFVLFVLFCVFFDEWFYDLMKRLLTRDIVFFVDWHYTRQFGRRLKQFAKIGNNISDTNTSIQNIAIWISMVLFFCFGNATFANIGYIAGM